MNSFPAEEGRHNLGVHILSRWKVLFRCSVESAVDWMELSGISPFLEASAYFRLIPDKHILAILAA